MAGRRGGRVAAGVSALHHGGLTQSKKIFARRCSPPDHPDPGANRGDSDTNRGGKSPAVRTVALAI